ncbi:MAG TPA: AraC family transcriptional regulator [Ignavibacteria bacterium]|nr:AraC family transcriptional regulator [Ignavibacteria bacterium]
MILRIKNMVCMRCMRVVREELEKLGFIVLDVKLGSAEVEREPDKDEIIHIKEVLGREGFELLDRKNEQLIEGIKNLVIDSVHYNKGRKEDEKFSDYLARNLKLDYNYLSNIFSSMEGVTIEKYIILQKIEKVKELMVYDDLSLSEIAFELDYSSTAHLSSQFKAVTGLTPSEFKSLSVKNRKPLDKLTK